MLNTSSPNTSLIIFSIRYSEFYQAAYTFKDVPEDAYYERIFCLFPLLRVCHLRFWWYVYDSRDSQLVLSLNKTFIPVETNLFNLQSLVLRECSPAFLLHLFEHHPQLQELSFNLSTPWLPDKHPLMNGYNKQSHWSYTVPALNNCLACINNITLDGRRSQINDEFLSYLPTVVSWHQITSLTIGDPSDLCQLGLLLSKMIHLRSLELHYHFDYDFDDDSNKQNLIHLFNDTSLCNILMSNGLQKLHLYTNWDYPDIISIAYLIVKQLPQMEIIELNCHNSSQVPETLHILMNGLPKLNFIIFHGFLTGENQQESKMRDLQKHCRRAYRMEYRGSLTDVTILNIWLQ
ncbi:unnamed protein product [Rotaria sp. Silwood2]|nr:unnamed protein product [Rotaria sp. Silwood2]